MKIGGYVVLFVYNLYALNIIIIIVKKNIVIKYNFLEMPFKCCVPKCSGNYKNGPKVSTFSYPKDEELRKKWLKAICREDFASTNAKVIFIKL